MIGPLHRIRRRGAKEPAGPPVSPAVPAGTEPESLAAPAPPSFRHRGRLRRRLRYLRRVRELGYRDVGGLIFDLRRFGRDEPGLVAAKLEALTAVDTELRGLEDALGNHRPVAELREPGVGACPRCAALHASDARFCSACGMDLRAAPKAAVTAPGTPIPIAEHPAPETAPGTNATLDAGAVAVAPDGQAPPTPGGPGDPAEQPTQVVAPVVPDADRS